MPLESCVAIKQEVITTHSNFSLTSLRCYTEPIKLAGSFTKDTKFINDLN